MKRILLVEDNKDEHEIISAALGSFGQVSAVTTTAEALAALETTTFNLIILDVTLPDGEGFKVCSAVQQSDRHSRTPLIFLTGRFGIEDKVMAFSLGAHDYIVKPYEMRELKARVGALLKRHDPKERDDSLSSGDIRISLASQRVFISGESGGDRLLDLTRLEYKLLVFFIRQPDRLLNREQIINSVWDGAIHITDRTVDTHISHLRKKLGASSCQISSVYGEGYRFTVKDLANPEAKSPKVRAS
jgi:DNA-binding response OmpR family regulator